MKPDDHKDEEGLEIALIWRVAMLLVIATVFAASMIYIFGGR